MNQDEMRKKIIKDKFDKLEPIVIDEGKNVVLVSDNNYGVYYLNTYHGFGINPYYFMFDFIGLSSKEDDETLREYANYIAGLSYDKFKLKYNLLTDYENPRRIIDYNRDLVKSMNEYIFDKRNR